MGIILLSVWFIRYLHRKATPLSTGCVFIFLVASIVPPVNGDTSCETTTTDSSGENVCDSNEYNSHVMDDAPNNISAEEEDTEEDLPEWWNYNIDELFEDHFDCGSIIYGYQTGQYDYDDDDTEDDDMLDDDDDDLGEDSDIKRNQKHAENADVVSETQLQKLRQQWKVMREKYTKEVNLVPIKAGVSALVVPNRIGDAGPEKGRGVFATEPIKEGELVVSLDNGSTAIFKDGHSWRKFAVSLLDKETACNFIEWSWVQTMEPLGDSDEDIRNGLTIFVAFDESNLMNAADWGDGVEANVRCGTPPKLEGDGRGPCRYHYYAARDIDAGEELLINYGEFEDLSQEGWTDIGL